MKNVKECSKCHQEKSLIDFYNRLSATDGKASLCKVCKNKKTVEWRNKNYDKWLAYCNKKNSSPAYEKKRKEYYYQGGGKERQAIREKRKDVRAARRVGATKPESRKKRAVWQKKRMKENISFKLNRIISCQISDSIHKNYVSWKSVLPYSSQELKTHLERQFDKRMNWENYGQYGWHIDHINPKKMFNIKEFGDAEFIACWALSNLRPFWGKDNIAKNNKRTHLI